MTSWNLYWLMRLDAVQLIFVMGASFSGMGLLIVFILWVTGGPSTFEEKEKAFRKQTFPWLKRLAITAAVFVVAATLTPSTKEMAFIIVAPKLYDAVSKNAELKAIPSKVVTLANEWLDELKPKKAE